ncbi:MAG: hypothetical protein A2802_00610 [Candidatus Woykebacteria bacterium RIFCSPHIGHO2_01_FULL_43_29]|uniref:Alpha/beta hydrolase n=2 Tax=Candidatus Woykeibacteriota TaxID=1817899 RepID=A0A1G1WWR7_9BACT|nr:MAG: hypothetical protein A2802_00610 [Candidatus Woykebacteria bacterium RIFCSPHIGHO2_01_FULL_43_29]OGY29991.1 MAG: hypothetical protein A3J50_02820 [Candidatus Woykebacteria bacterium RIFCSPHIGHO2_02_FULL_43_16b]OGY32021.1 MAG: hypothetical protein A3A61_01220 [Candidatus Woykebacteria bacterium RIFCSPLOWO2_01_FULL_43_14]
MNPRVFIVHGWGAYPQDDWIPWLKSQLEDKGCEVYNPSMPDTEHPKIETWVQLLTKLVGEINETTYFVGHSIGCQTILRYLESLPSGKKVGGVVLVAPWVHLLPECVPTPEDKKIAHPWLTTPINWEKIKTHTNQITTIFSDNDGCVPLTDADIFQTRLETTPLIEHDKGHFSGSDNITELPSALSAVLNMIH